VQKYLSCDYGMRDGELRAELSKALQSRAGAVE